MTLQMIEGNILDIEEGYILQQVNCRGVMGSGLAKQIREKYPQVYTEYQYFCKKWEPEEILGWYNMTAINNYLGIVNIFGQVGYGRTGRFTNYGAVAMALIRANKLEELNKTDLPVYVPFQMGCGLGGGDWEVYSEIIEFFIPDAIVVKLGELS